MGLEFIPRREDKDEKELVLLHLPVGSVIRIIGDCTDQMYMVTGYSKGGRCYLVCKYPEGVVLPELIEAEIDKATPIELHYLGYEDSFSKAYLRRTFDADILNYGVMPVDLAVSEEEPHSKHSLAVYSCFPIGSVVKAEDGKKKLVLGYAEVNDRYIVCDYPEGIGASSVDELSADNLNTYYMAGLMSERFRAFRKELRQNGRRFDSNLRNDTDTTEKRLARENIEAFNETMKRFRGDEKLMQLTDEAIAGTRIYDEGFVSDKKPVYKDMEVSFEESFTLMTAADYAGSKRTAVLNFANPLKPGCGTMSGGDGQENYLCRESNLYLCLTSANAADYYSEHQKEVEERVKRDVIYSSDRVIYSPGVAVTEGDPDPLMRVDVLTCAAPVVLDREKAPDDPCMKELLCRRIRNILEVAIDNDIEALVLGAFGCGTCRNSPYLVSDAFQSVLLEDRYRYAFRNVVFSVRRTGWFCENIEAFEITFRTFPSLGGYFLSRESNKRRFFE